MTDSIPKDHRFATKPDPIRSDLIAEIDDDSGGILVMVKHRDDSEACRYLSLDEAAALRDWLDTVLPNE